MTAIRMLLPTGHADPAGTAKRRLALHVDPHFDFPVTAVGIVGLCSMYFDPALGRPGLILADEVFTLIPQAIIDCELAFGMAGRAFNVIVAPLEAAGDGSGGAYHYGCDFATGRTLYCDAALGNPERVLGLAVAELAECFMGLQRRGWDCGASNGEALSRFLAEMASGGANGALADFATGPAWDQAGRPNWIDSTAPTDQDPVSIGCGMVYLYWMRALGYSVPQITRAGGATLAENYHAVTGREQAAAWHDFVNAATRFPPGSITRDNPWAPGPGRP